MQHTGSTTGFINLEIELVNKQLNRTGSMTNFVNFGHGNSKFLAVECRDEQKTFNVMW